MQAQVANCDDVKRLENRLASISDLLMIEVTEVATSVILSCGVSTPEEPVQTCEKPLDFVGYNIPDGFTCTNEENGCDASQVTCANGYVGTAQVRCLAGSYELHGCNRECALTSSNSRYVLPAGFTGCSEETCADADIACADGFEGSPRAICEPDGTLTLEGCSTDSNTCEFALEDTYYNVPSGFVCTVDSCDATGITCKDGYSGTPQAQCLGNSFYRLSGCTQVITEQDCTQPSDMTGYVLNRAIITCNTYSCPSNQFSCASEYNGDPEVMCTGGDYRLTGCTQPGSCYAPLEKDGYVFPDTNFVCTTSSCEASQISCADGYDGTPQTRCRVAGQVEVAGCTLLDSGTRTGTETSNDDQSWAEEHVEIIIVGFLLVLIVLVCVMAWFVCKKPEKVYVQTMPAQPRMEMTDFATVQRSYHAGVTPSLRTVETLHPIDQRTPKRTPDPVQPRSVPVRSNMNSQYQITNNQVTDVSAMYGDVLYGDVTPAGPDGLDSAIGGGNAEGSTVNANRLKRGPARSTQNSGPNMGGHVAPDDDFEGDIGTL